MEIKNIEREKTIKIDTEEGEVFLEYKIKMKIMMQNKELEVVEKMWRRLMFDYDKDSVTKNLELIDDTMKEFEKNAEELLKKIKNSFENLEQLVEKYGYQVI